LLKINSLIFLALILFNRSTQHSRADIYGQILTITTKESTAGKKSGDRQNLSVFLFIKESDKIP
jgi:hypothetical protein